MFKYLGHGLGLRPPHYQRVIDERPPVGWFEVISENFMEPGGNPRRVLRAVREHYPVVLHGVSLSLGSTDPLDERYLDALATLAAEVDPAWISDHLSWSSFGGHTVHDLWPLPYTAEAIAHVAERIERVQDRLGRRILIENVSTYLQYTHSTMPEWEFVAAVLEDADCGLLLDVNNVYVSACNNGFDPRRYLAAIPAARVGQIHLAGHSDEGTHLLDTHDHPVCDEVWTLYRETIERIGRRSTMIEWDDHIPSLERLLDESGRAIAVESEALMARGGVVRGR
jgi:uncharacterized protein (UPF0276 family)